MTTLQTLDNTTHKNTRIITKRGADFGDNIHLALVVPREVPRVLAHYPIFFTKSPKTGQFFLSALLGFDPDENLFLNGDQWRAGYLPISMECGPFAIGAPAGETLTHDNAVVQIDMDHSRVQAETGERLFDDDGQQTDYLARIVSILAELSAGSQQTSSLVAAARDADLIEPVRLDIEFADKRKINFEGLYTVHAEKLATLEGDNLANLHKPGHLKLLHEIAASTVHVQTLIDIRNQQQ